jgi:hypothetical protein
MWVVLEQMGLRRRIGQGTLKLVVWWFGNSDLKYLLLKMLLIFLGFPI